MGLGNRGLREFGLALSRRSMYEGQSLIRMSGALPERNPGPLTCFRFLRRPPSCQRLKGQTLAAPSRVVSNGAVHA